MGRGSTIFQSAESEPTPNLFSNSYRNNRRHRQDVFGTSVHKQKEILVCAKQACCPNLTKIWTVSLKLPKHSCYINFVIRVGALVFKEQRHLTACSSMRVFPLYFVFSNSFRRLRCVSCLSMPTFTLGMQKKKCSCTPVLSGRCPVIPFEKKSTM